MRGRCPLRAGISSRDCNRGGGSLTQVPPHPVYRHYRVHRTELTSSKGSFDRVLRVPHGSVDGTFNLIYFAFVLELRIASNAAGCFFDFAYALFLCTLHMFLVHMTPRSN